MDETVIIVTGSEALAPSVISALPRDAIIIAADGALDHALAAGLQPAGLVGDLDSVSPDGLAWAEAHATIQRHEPDKDHTDTELALAFAATFQPARIMLVSGGGDRIDHTLAAVGALGHPSLTSVPEIDAWWGEQRMRILHGPGRTTLDLVPGTIVSLIATHGPCTGVSISGTEWELDHIELPPMVGHGVSNVATAEPVEIATSTGVLTIFIQHADPRPRSGHDDAPDNRENR